LQTHCPQLPVLPGENLFLVSPMSDVPSELPVSDVHMSQQAAWCRPGRNCFPCAIQPVCKRYADAVSPRSAVTLRRRHGSRGHVPQPLPSRQLTGGLHLQTRALATRLEDLYQRLQEHGDALHNQMHPKTQANSYSRRANSVGRNATISRDQP
jgi:hypothetical protein